jgi:CubicO group peptidase (beta-lactamase class C family)
MRNNRVTLQRLLLCALILLVSQSAALAQDHAAKIQEVLALAHKYKQFNGSALIATNGKVIYKGAFGMANMEWNIPNTPDTRFRLGSITKQFTSMLALQLVEQGKLKLDGKISDYLPDYRKDVGDKVTIHHLLTHTSGIPSYTSQPGFFENVSRNPYKVDGVREEVREWRSGIRTRFEVHVQQLRLFSAWRDYRASHGKALRASAQRKHSRAGWDEKHGLRSFRHAHFQTCLRLSSNR